MNYSIMTYPIYATQNPSAGLVVNQLDLAGIKLEEPTLQLTLQNNLVVKFHEVHGLQWTSQAVVTIVKQDICMHLYLLNRLHSTYSDPVWMALIV